MLLIYWYRLKINFTYMNMRDFFLHAQHRLTDITEFCVRMECSNVEVQRHPRMGDVENKLISRLHVSKEIGSVDCRIGLYSKHTPPYSGIRTEPAKHLNRCTPCISDTFAWWDGPIPRGSNNKIRDFQPATKINRSTYPSIEGASFVGIPK